MLPTQRAAAGRAAVVRDWSISLLRALSLALDAINRALEIVVGLMVVAIVVIMFVEIVGRSLLRVGLPWTQELARFVQIWLGFLGGVLAVRRWTHFQLTSIERILPLAMQRVLRAFAALLVMVFGLLMLRYGIDVVKITFPERSEILQLNTGVLYSVVPVAGVLMTLFAIPHLAAAVRRHEKPATTVSVAGE